MNNIVYEFTQGDFIISTDKTKLQLSVIHVFLSKESYWARNIPLKVVARSLKNSLTFGVFDKQNQQVGFARVITDFAVFATLGDVFIIKEKRGLGLAQWLINTILTLPELKSIRRWTLYTDNAHKLYEKSGFRLLERPDLAMEINKPNIYEYYQE
jgi:GNAT superfamily N-acetyltransferase